MLLLGLVLAIAMFPMLGEAVAQSQLLMWLVLQGGLTIYRIRWVARARDELAAGHSFSEREHAHYTFFSFLAGCVWGGLVLFLNPDQALLYHALVFAALLAVSIGSLFLYSTRPVLQLAFTLPVLLPLAGWCLSQGAVFYIWAGALVVAFVLMQLIFLASNWRLVVRSTQELAARDMQLNLIQNENAHLQQRVEVNHFSERELKRDRQLFVDGPVVMYRCAAREGWPIERISDNISQFGYDAATLQRGHCFNDLIHPEDLGYVLQEDFGGGMEGGSGVRLEYRLRRNDGSFCWVYDYTMPVFDDRGRMTHLDGYLLDIDRLYEANEALAKEKERAQVTLESIGDAVITTNTQGRIDFMNSVAEKLTGWTFSLARHTPLAEVFRIRQGEKGWVGDPVQSFLDSTDLGDGRQKEADLYSRQGVRALITYNAAPIRSHDDRLLGHVLVFLDVTDKKDMQRELEFQARHDVLTGLLNRREFERKLTALINSAKSERREHVLLYIDLDQFKLVNDTCGHAAGDELLIQLTHDLQKYLRPDDTFARLGGDEFGILLENCGLERGQEMSQIIRSAVKQYQFNWDGRTFDVGASIGLVAIDKGSLGIGQVMSAADVACYSAKENGRNRVCVYQDGDKELTRREVEMDWATRISKSMEDGLLVLYFQDIVPVTSGGQVDPRTPRHIEILLRIRDTEGRHVEPEAFLSSAERYNLMPDLDRWVVRNSFEWFNQHHFGDDLQMSINLSGLTLSDADFAATVKRLLLEYNVPPSSVCFEITETAAIASLATAADFMEELKLLGCRFSLDDFGSGLSSFAYLKALPVDYLKIDGNFVRNILTNSVDRAMVGAINDIGHTMQLKTVAEYVNDIKILPELEALGVDFAQGYAIARPRKLRELRATISTSLEMTHEMPLSLH